MEIYASKQVRQKRKSPAGGVPAKKAKPVETKYADYSIDLTTQNYDPDYEKSRHDAQQLLPADSDSDATEIETDEEMSLTEAEVPRRIDTPKPPQKKKRVTLKKDEEAKVNEKTFSYDIIISDIMSNEEILKKIKAKLEEEGFDPELCPITPQYLKKQLENKNALLLDHVNKMKMPAPIDEPMVPLARKKLSTAKKTPQKLDQALQLDADFTQKLKNRPKSFFVKFTDRHTIGVGKAEGQNKANQYFSYDSYFLNQYHPESLKGEKTEDKPMFSMQIPVRAAHSLLRGLDACIQKYESCPSLLKIESKY